MRCTTCPKTAHLQSSEVNISEVSKEKCNADTTAEDELLHQLSAQVQALSQVVSSLQSNAPTAVKQSTSEPRHICQCSNKQSKQLRKDCCLNCMARLTAVTALFAVKRDNAL